LLTIKKINKMDATKIENTVNQITPDKAAEVTTQGLNLITRVIAPTPIFWTRVRNVSAIFATLGGAIALASGILTIPAIAKLIVVVGATLAGAAQTTVKGE
jgi:hypothetical protein